MRVGLQDNDGTKFAPLILGTRIQHHTTKTPTQRLRRRWPFLFPPPSSPLFPSLRKSTNQRRQLRAI